MLSLLLLTACGSSTWQYNPITDVNNLEGRRVGVNLAWEADYALTGREDMELYRYDETADMVMALGYDKIDAIGLDDVTWKILEVQAEGLERTEPVCQIGYCGYFGADDEELVEDFNLFLESYQQTKEYQDLVASIESFDGIHYEGPNIPLTGTGKVLNVGIDPAGFPRAHYEPGSDVPTGFDVEPIKAYANDRGYQISFAEVTIEGALAGLQSGSFDIYVSYIGDVYAEEAEYAGLHVCNPMHYSPVYFIQKTQERISVALENM